MNLTFQHHYVCGIATYDVDPNHLVSLPVILYRRLFVRTKKKNGFLKIDDQIINIKTTGIELSPSTEPLINFITLPISKRHEHKHVL